MESDPTELLNLAVIAFPVIALVTTLAIDTVDEMSHWLYRVVIGVVGIFAITTGAMGASRAFVGYGIDIYFENAIWYTFLSFAAAGFLTIIVIIQEITVGMEETWELAVVLGSILVMLLLMKLAMSGFAF